MSIVLGGRKHGHVLDLFFLGLALVLLLLLRRRWQQLGCVFVRSDEIVFVLGQTEILVVFVRREVVKGRLERSILLFVLLDFFVGRSRFLGLVVFRSEHLLVPFCFDLLIRILSCSKGGTLTPFDLAHVKVLIDAQLRVRIDIDRRSLALLVRIVIPVHIKLFIIILIDPIRSRILLVPSRQRRLHRLPNLRLHLTVRVVQIDQRLILLVHRATQSLDLVIVVIVGDVGEPEVVDGFVVRVVGFFRIGTAARLGLAFRRERRFERVQRGFLGKVGVEKELHRSKEKPEIS
ncbi:BQ5605_C002g01431 [Microbotryum silenes-dioicae]|uniref:BQ5605_C002g01431 protein n=1 Tax=Microbotryum silenes-dioicae TaxID=796604 RepID=A0A2X0M2L9_9BASI|nr:BQ5605_C002g01431 [Microbotryum silenes-dioicae]